MRFLTQAKLKFEYLDHNNVKWYTLKQNLVFDNDTEELIIIPRAIFRTDGATIPKGLRWLFKPLGKYTNSTILHDFMYCDKSLKRSYCDYVFYKAMKSDGVGFLTRSLFWLAVRVGGWAYRN